MKRAWHLRNREGKVSKGAVKKVKDSKEMWQAESNRLAVLRSRPWSQPE